MSEFNKDASFEGLVKNMTERNDATCKSNCFAQNRIISAKKQITDDRLFQLYFIYANGANAGWLEKVTH